MYVYYSARRTTTMYPTNCAQCYVFYWISSSFREFPDCLREYVSPMGSFLSAHESAIPVFFYISRTVIRVFSGSADREKMLSEIVSSFASSRVINPSCNVFAVVRTTLLMNSGLRSQTENTPIFLPDSSASSYELVPTRARMVQGTYKESSLALYASAADDCRKFRRNTLWPTT
ncbi:uncharacterized protein LOC134223654 [Armigeres subalbatus]|uniref:uncharacterized protein LOC134223654 n=1 Tax=Armigeres subalbatus TaxID=124917 RepID=UPI002ED50125